LAFFNFFFAISVLLRVPSVESTMG